VASAFDITERLSYGDIVAAGAAILGRSGADTAAVRLDGEQMAAAGVSVTAAQQAFFTGEQVFAPLTGTVGAPEGFFGGEEGLFTRRGLELQAFVDSLTAAAGNR